VPPQRMWSYKGRLPVRRKGVQKGKVLDLTDIPIEPLVYTTEEFEELKTSNNPFITEVLKTAIRLD